MQEFDCETKAEIVRLFPRLARDNDSYGPAARPSLRRHEVQVLRKLAY